MLIQYASGDLWRRAKGLLLICALVLAIYGLARNPIDRIQGQALHATNDVIEVITPDAEAAVPAMVIVAIVAVVVIVAVGAYITKKANEKAEAIGGDKDSNGQEKDGDDKKNPSSSSHGWQVNTPKIVFDDGSQVLLDGSDELVSCSPGACTGPEADTVDSNATSFASQYLQYALASDDTQTVELNRSMTPDNWPSNVDHVVISDAYELCFDVDDGPASGTTDVDITMEAIQLAADGGPNGSSTTYAIALVQIEGEDEEVIWRWQATAIQDSQPNHSPLEAGMTATTGVGTFEMEDAQVTKTIALDGSGAASACIRYYTESVAY